MKLFPQDRAQRNDEHIVEVPQECDQERVAAASGCSGASGHGGNRCSCASHTSSTNRGAVSGYPSVPSGGVNCGRCADHGA